MATPTNTFSTYDSVGAKESVADKIWNVDPYDRPFLSKMAKTKTTQKLHEWQTDVLDTPADNNFALEGDDHSGAAITPTVSLNNFCQIQRKDFVISGSDLATAKYGRGNETAYQKTLKKLALMNDVEKSMFANVAKAAGSESVGRRMAGMPTWLTTNTSVGTGGADATGDGSDTRTNGTQRAFTETLLKGVLAGIYDNSGKKPDCMMAGSFNRQAASAFTGSSTRFDRGEDGKVTAHIDVYEYDFGSIRMEASRHIRPRDAFICTSDMWEYAQFRPMFEQEIPQTGDSQKTMILTEGTLVCRNEKANGLIADLTTS